MALRTYTRSKRPLNDTDIAKKPSRKRKKTKIIIAEVPARSEPYLTDESLKVETNDTFDKLLKGTVYNSVLQTSKPVKYDSSDNEFVRSQSIIKSPNNSSFSPRITRSRRKANFHISETSSEQSTGLKSCEIIIENSLPAVSPKQTLENNKKSAKFLIPKNAKLNETVDQSLYVEAAKDCSDDVTLSLSNLKLSRQMENSSILTENNQFYASTPLVLNKKKLVRPFLVDSVQNESSGKEISSNQLLKSFNHCVVQVEEGFRGFSPEEIDKSKNTTRLFENCCKSIFTEQNKTVLDGSKSVLLIADSVIENSQDEIRTTSLEDNKANIYDNQVVNLVSSDEDSPAAFAKQKNIIINISTDDSYIEKSSVKKKIGVNRKSRRKTSINRILEFKQPLMISTPKVVTRRKKSSTNTVQFDEDLNEISFINNSQIFDESKRLTLKPGKQYRRSIKLLSRASIAIVTCQKGCKCVRCKIEAGPKIEEESLFSEYSDVSILNDYARRLSKGYVLPESQFIESILDESIRNLSLKSREKSSFIEDHHVHHQHHHDVDNENEDQHHQGPGSELAPLGVTARDIVLRRCCQTEPIPFEQCYSKALLGNCQKIGEGVYGEVFLCKNPQRGGGTSVMKIIPIEGDQIVNNERQKRFDEILTEIVIAMELSNLRNKSLNKCDTFNEVQQVKCVKGRYPERLIDLWELFDETRGSENDSPTMFGDDQLYIVLELDNCGADLEAFTFKNAQQAYSMFKQIACALAVAESQLKFEHRDLHWGNVLLKPVDKTEKFVYYLNGNKFEVLSEGIQASIIDFTLSRIEFDGVVIFNDLSLDPELFQAEGDYQFEIYRLMQKNNRNNWKEFNPFSNILWLHYILDKAVTSALRYKNLQSKLHKQYIERLKKFQDNILSYKSAVDFVTNAF